MVDVVSWPEVSPQQVQPYHVVVVTGASRRNKIDPIDLDRPVLGYGVFGCAYFGSLRLKNGQPYT